MSTFSPSLRIELITTGDQAGVWGNTTNTNLGTLVESAIAGYVSVSVIAPNQALTALNGAADQSRNMTIALTTTTGAAFNVYAPPAEKTYVIQNASAFAATIFNSTTLGNTTAAGTGVTVPAGRTVTVWSDGTNFAFQNNHLASLTLATDLAVVDGGTGASDAAGARTSFGLGTIATQNANTVSITGGSITGITDLAVADGGTGASDAAGARTSFGATTLGANLFTLANVAAIAFPRFNADNTISSLAAADFRTAIGAGTSSTTGTVTSVGGTGTVSGLSLSGTVTTSGNLSLSGTLAVLPSNFASQTANTVLAAPNGAAGVPTFRALLAADIPTLNQNTTGTAANVTGIVAIANGGTGASTVGVARGNLGLGTMATQPANNVDITGGFVTGIEDLLVSDGGTGASDAAGARTNLGLGTIATQAANNVTITGGSITGITDLAVADGGTGASTFTSGGLLRGNGTSALSVASAANIVAAIGTTAVTNATNATNATTAATQAFGNNSTAIATTAFVQAALQVLHPVGSIYINAGVTTNPATLLGFGTWVAFGAGRVMVGLNGSDALFDALEETGGSKDATLVSHNHTFSGTTGGQSADHNHRLFEAASQNPGGLPEVPFNGSVNGVLSNDTTANTSNDHAHGYSGTTSTQGSSATNANLQPYITVAMWKRTA